MTVERTGTCRATSSIHIRELTISRLTYPARRGRIIGRASVRGHPGGKLIRIHVGTEEAAGASFGGTSGPGAVSSRRSNAGYVIE